MSAMEVGLGALYAIGAVILVGVVLFIIGGIAVTFGGVIGWGIASLYNAFLGASLNPMLGALVGSIVSLYTSTLTLVLG